MRTVLVACAVLSVFGSAQPASVSDIVAKLDGYLADYEPQLSALVADEVMVQEVRRRSGDLRRRDANGMPIARHHPRNRPRLVSRLDGHERVRGIDTTRVLFTERMTPTVIRNPNGNSMPSVIRAWIDPASGGLWRAEVTTFESAETREMTSRIRVEFSRHKAFNLLVPIEMRETFPIAPPDSGSGVAHYTNFRRFGTSARIVPQ